MFLAPAIFFLIVFFVLPVAAGLLLSLTDFDIYSINLDGTGLEVIVAGLDRPRDVALDPIDGRIYWVDEASGLLQGANLDGSGLDRFSSSASSAARPEKPARLASATSISSSVVAWTASTSIAPYGRIW